MSQLKIIIGNKTYSSWSLRGWLAVHHTGLDYEEILLQLDTPAFYEEIEKYSPARKVPTLLHGDTAIWDSAAIIDYCAKLAPEKNWWPEDLADYGHARALFNEMHSGFTEIRNNMPMNLRDHWTGLTCGEKLTAELKRVEALFTECREAHSDKGAFLFGEYGAVDMMYAPLVTRLDTYGVRLNDTAAAYVQAILAHPAFKKWRAAADKETEVVEIDQLAADIKHLG